MIHPWEQPMTGALARQVDRMRATLPVIDTARLRLRPARIEDFGTYASIYGSDRWGHDAPVSDEDIWLDFCQLVAGWLLRGTGLMGIEDRTREQDGSLLGFVLINHEYGDPEPELGWMLCAEAEGRGIAHEAALALRRHADGLGMGALVSYIGPPNMRSARLAERLGAVRDPTAEAALGGDVLVYRHPVVRTGEQP